MTSELKFNKAILSTVTNPIPTREVLVRLQQLLDALTVLDQEKVDLKSISSIKNDLVNKKLLRNNNVGIQAYTCCCLAEILRLYAPDAPYTASELFLIFKTIFSQLKRIGDLENPYFQQQSFLLKLLADVRSIVLITDLPDHTNLIESIFQVAYDLTKSSKFNDDLQQHMAQILSEVISESEEISESVLKMILNRFLNQESSSFTNSKGISNPGLNFSIIICENNVDRMLREVAKLFSETLYDESGDTQIVDDETSNHSIVNDKLRKIHKLTIQIWKYVPEMLTSIMGLIEDELKADDELVRLLATETIGDMIASTTTVNKVNFMITHKETWIGWLKKSMDVSGTVRCKWVEQITVVITGDVAVPTEYINELITGYIKCLLDIEERVRFAACRALTKLGYRIILEKLCTKDIIQTLLQLIREKNPEIRNEVLKILGSLYNTYLTAKSQGDLIYFSLLTNEEDSKEICDIILRDIPNNILSLIYINDKQITASVDVCLFEVLLPLESNSAIRVDRICQFYSVLSEKSRNSFLAIAKRQQQISKVVLKYLDFVSNLENKENRIDFFSNNEGKNNNLQKLDKIINWLCVSFPEGLNTFSCLERFYKLNNNRYFYLLRIIESTDSDYASVKNSMKELLSKLASAKNLKLQEDRSTVSTTDMVSNFKLLLYRSGMILYNRSNVSELLNIARDTSNHWHEIANSLLENISTVVPDVFQSEMEGLRGIILGLNNENELEEDNDKSNVLRILYHLIKKYPELLPNDSEFIEKLKEFSLKGKLNECKYSIKILGRSNRKELYSSYIYDTIFPIKVDDSNFTLKLCAIAELYLIDPILLQDKSSEIATLLIKEVLLVNKGEHNLVETEHKKEDEKNLWIDDSELEAHPQLLQKLLTLRVFINRLKSYNGDILTSEELESTAQLVLKLISLLIGNGGEIVNDDKQKTPLEYQVQLRFHAGLSLLKLAKISQYEKFIDYKLINRLIYLIQDVSVQVRTKFLQKLENYLSNDTISDKFLHLVFFVAFDPSSELKLKTGNWIQSLHGRYEKKKLIQCEVTFLRLIHCISHMNEFKEVRAKANALKNDEEQYNIQLNKAITFAIEFISFYVKNIAKSENVSLLYYFASRIKQYRDATLDQRIYDLTGNNKNVDPETLNLYCVAEIAQLTVKEFCDIKGWPMQSWPGKVKLAAELFAPMKSTREAQFVISQVYIPDLVQKLMTRLLKYKLVDGRKRPHKISLEPSLAVKRKKEEVVESEQPLRKSSRLRNKVSYTEGNDES